MRLIASVARVDDLSPLVTMYVDYYPINRCPTFLCYYIFTASIMHVTARTSIRPCILISLLTCLQSRGAQTIRKRVWASRSA